MDTRLDLPFTAARVAELGPAVALDEDTSARLRAVITHPEVIAAVARRVGSPDRAKAWLDGLGARAKGSIQQPDDDHALLVGGLAALAP